MIPNSHSTKLSIDRFIKRRFRLSTLSKNRILVEGVINVVDKDSIYTDVPGHEDDVDYSESLNGDTRTARIIFSISPVRPATPIR